MLNFTRDNYLLRVLLRDIFGKYFERFACCACLAKLSGPDKLASTHNIEALTQGVSDNREANAALGPMCEFVVRVVMPRYLQGHVLGDHPSYPTLVQNALLLLSKMFGRLCMHSATLARQGLVYDDSPLLQLYEST